MHGSAPDVMRQIAEELAANGGALDCGVTLALENGYRVGGQRGFWTALRVNIGRYFSPLDGARAGARARFPRWRVEGRRRCKPELSAAMAVATLQPARPLVPADTGVVREVQRPFPAGQFVCRSLSFTPRRFMSANAPSGGSNRWHLRFKPGSFRFASVRGDLQKRENQSLKLRTENSFGAAATEDHQTQPAP